MQSRVPLPTMHEVSARNALSDLGKIQEQMTTNRIKQIQEKYMPLTTQADAFSKIAYANMVGPQFVNKIMNNPELLANLDPNERKNILNALVNTGMSKTPQNAFNQTQNQEGNEPLVPWLQNQIKNVFSQKTPSSGNQQSQNALIKPTMQDNENVNAINQPDLQQGEQIDPWAKNVGQYKGDIKQGEKEGEFRAENINDLELKQLGLSEAGNSMDRAIEIVTNPKFQKLKDDIPFFQDKQLSLLSSIGSQEQQDMIGDFISTAQKMQGDAVNSFKGKAMQREFDYAQKLKINESDTFGVALGKLRALKALKEIAQQKNDIMINLMRKKVPLNEAIKQANKQVDVRKIENDVKELLAPRIKLLDEDGNAIYVTKAEAKRLVEGEE